MAEAQEPEDPTQDPHFVPEDHPDFVPYPVEPFMDASGPTDRDAPDLGPAPPNFEGLAEYDDA